MHRTSHINKVLMRMEVVVCYNLRAIYGSKSRRIIETEYAGDTTRFFKS